MQGLFHGRRLARALGIGSLVVLGCSLGCSVDVDDGSDGASGGAGPSSGGVDGGGVSSGGATSGGATQGSGGLTESGGATGTGGSDMNGDGGSEASGGADGTGSDEVPDGAACADVADWPDDWSAREDEILTLVNEHRAAGANCGGEARPPVEPLSMDPHLRCAARLHSMDMAERDYFSHGTWDESADACSNDGQCASGYTCQPRTSGSTPSRCGKSPSLRVQEVGGPMGAGWENIAAGNSTAADTMNQWMNSTGHCNNIMNGNLRTIGVGYYGGGSFGHYWTQGFDN
jgi:uncharacterized protein YkwD